MRCILIGKDELSSDYVPSEAFSIKQYSVFHLIVSLFVMVKMILVSSLNRYLWVLQLLRALTFTFNIQFVDTAF